MSMLTHNFYDTRQEGLCENFLEYPIFPSSLLAA